MGLTAKLQRRDWMCIAPTYSSVFSAATSTLLLAVVPQISAVAQDAEAGHVDRVLEQVTVTAQKREQDMQEVPVSVEVLGAEQLSRAQLHLITDLPTVAPSLNFDKRGTGSMNFAMRGIGAFAQHAGIQPGIGLVIDGVPLLRGFEYDMELSDVENVQLLTGPQGTLFGANTLGGVVQVTTRRPSATFEGYADAVFTSDEEKFLRMGVSGPLSERVRARFVAYGRDREGYIENIYPGMKPAGGEETWGVSGKIEFDVTENLNVLVRGDYREMSTNDTTHYTVVEPGAPNQLAVMGNGDPVLGQRIVDTPDLANSDIDQMVETDNRGFAIEGSWAFDDALQLKSISSLRETNGLSSVDIDLSPARPSDPMGRPFVSVRYTNTAPFIGRKVEYFTQELRLEYASPLLDALFGVYYQDLDETMGVGDGPMGVPLLLGGGALFLNQEVRSDFNQKVKAAFTDVTFHVGPVDLFAGFRWTDEQMTSKRRQDLYMTTEFTVVGEAVNVNPGVSPLVTTQVAGDASNGEWSGRAGALWHVNPDVNLYFTAARGFTGASANAEPTSPADAFIRPSTAVSYELGAKATLLGDHLRLNAALFNIELDDIQAEKVDVTTASVITFNAGEFRSRGLEAGATLLVGEQLTLTGVMTYLDTEHGRGITQPCYFQQTEAEGCVTIAPGVQVQYLDGKPGLDAPELKYNLGAIYDLPLAGSFDAHFSLNYVWQDWRQFELTHDPIGNYQKPYDTLDITAGITAKDGKYEVTLFGKNVLDEQYKAFAQSDAGRNARARGFFPRGAFAYYGVNLKYNFK